MNIEGQNETFWGFEIFILINILFYLSIGLGLLLRFKWSFAGFRFFHTLLFYNWPIGTYLAIFFQEHLNSEGINEYFGEKIKGLKKRKAPFSK